MGDEVARISQGQLLIARTDHQEHRPDGGEVLVKAGSEWTVRLPPEGDTALLGASELAGATIRISLRDPGFGQSWRGR